MFTTDRVHGADEHAESTGEHLYAGCGSSTPPYLRVSASFAVPPTLINCSVPLEVASRATLFRVGWQPCASHCLMVRSAVKDAATRLAKPSSARTRNINMFFGAQFWFECLVCVCSQLHAADL